MSDIYEKEIPMQAFQVRAYCKRPSTVEGFSETTCDGDVMCTGGGITTNVTMWSHSCRTCGHVSWHEHSYPYIAHRPIK